MDFENFVCISAMAFRELVRVLQCLSGTWPYTEGLPQAQLTLFWRPCAGKKSEHRSDLVPGGGENTDLEDPVQIWLLRYPKDCF